MIERKIYQDGSLVVTRCSGVMQAEELIGSAHWMVDNYGKVIKPGFSQIFDALNASTDAISEEDIHRIAHINLSRGSNRQAYSMAILAIKPYPIALAKLHKLLSTVSGDSVELFNDVDEAIHWLNGRLGGVSIDKGVLGY